MNLGSDALSNAIFNSLEAVNDQLGDINANGTMLEIFYALGPFISWFAVILLVFLGVRAIVKVAKMMTR